MFRYAEDKTLYTSGKIEWTCSISGSLPLTVCLLPLAPTIPRYKAWSYLVRNEVAEEVGQKMFYTDSTGDQAQRCVQHRL